MYSPPARAHELPGFVPCQPHGTPRGSSNFDRINIRVRAERRFMLHISWTTVYADMCVFTPSRFACITKGSLRCRTLPAADVMQNPRWIDILGTATAGGDAEILQCECRHQHDDLILLRTSANWPELDARVRALRRLGNFSKLMIISC